MLLSREAILGVDDAVSTILSVPVPEWGGEVNIRLISGKEREKFEADMQRQIIEGTLRARLAALCICDDQGKPFFTYTDVESLAKKSARALDRVFNAALKHNAMRKQDIKELEKNSEAPDPTCGATPSDSPAAIGLLTSTD